ncbi:TPA: YSIRK signal domain/LPXTG anchor domain surface protein [Streptococcus suis]|uniref:Surface-anchored protein n=1 Tax=Streptococcus suis TaxID=1307 RepID=A0A116QJZ8_STRSU|nr:YSIRK signal domain/LPXTG anchor domain surface protein [Streptococcus suis]MBO8111991.1 YSIRK signal domain/LPXTG anchor domain surface protein [Streptococcus suis]MBS8090937.1 YSIRK signal domain/LPXTG anchor domain surface protein [Streptococcus suis]MCB2852620.1 YSIRK signal domain/LPXTG anchor domain surface protein [Streptococcus suis]MCB2858590.1 YSIRK signal domain/LPXTG anchor domain surface protein [Streptococcus suis]MCB2864841.1 YSIRK signal domain/LPXTG anchor domain surface pr
METANKKFRYSIRKFKVGVGSVLIATCLLGAGISTPTAFAMTDSSTATETTKTPLQHLKELVEELKMDLEELKKVPEYDSSKYSFQKYLWDDNLKYGKGQMDLASTLKEEDSKIPNIEGLVDFRNHIKLERLTRQVAQYRIKYPDNEEIENEYKVHLEQRDDANYASQIGSNLENYTQEAEQAFERIKEIVKKLEPKAEEPAPVPEAPTPKGDAEAPKDEKEVPAPVPTPDIPKEEEAPEPKAEEGVPTPAPVPETPMDEPKMEEPKSEMPAPAPKEEEVPVPTPEAEAPKAEEEIPAPMPEAPAPIPEEPKTDKVESDKQMPEAKQPEMEQPKAEDMPKEEMPKAEQPKAGDSAPKTAVPEVAPKTAEKPKLDFTTKERKVEEALPIKEEIRYDASLALGKSYLLQEGRAGKKVSVYQDVIVDGKVVATNLLSETVVEGQNRILVKGSLEMKKEEVKITPSVQSNPTLSHKGAPSANKATLPATGEQRNNLSLVGLGLAGISLAVVATAINKKSKDQI